MSNQQRATERARSSGIDAVLRKPIDTGLITGVVALAANEYDIFNPDLGRYVEFASLPSIMTCKNDSLRVPLLFDPGTRWEYGIGIDLAGRIVEEVSGQNLETYMRGHIFDPLGMNDTSFFLP